MHAGAWQILLDELTCHRQQMATCQHQYGCGVLTPPPACCVCAGLPVQVMTAQPHLQHNLLDIDLQDAIQLRCADHWQAAPHMCC
jgi:hypothetical protein